MIRKIRQEVFETMAKSNQPRLIFTFFGRIILKRTMDYIEYLINLFASHGAETYIVELEADLETRLKRNKTELVYKKNQVNAISNGLNKKS